MVEIKGIKPNIVIKTISKPSVAMVIETHFEINITAIEMSNQMVVIQVQIGKNTIEDVLLNGEENVNTITKKFITQLSLPKLKLAPYHFKMANQSMTKTLGIIKNLKIHIHGIPYVVTFIVLQNNVVGPIYFMLLKRLRLKDAKVTHDWGNNVIIVQNNINY